MKKITRERLEQFLARYQTQERVLDIGAGGSSYNTFFPNRVTVDIDPARKPDTVADAHALPFTDESFEVVLSTEMLEHVRDPQTVTRELMRVLKPGGRLILTTRFAFPLHDSPHDYWRFTPYGLKELFKDWDIEVVEPETGTFTAIAVLLQRISYQSVFRMNLLVKVVLRIAIAVFRGLEALRNKEYGDINRTKAEEVILSSGYHIVVRKQAR